jgi:hypothetical protein
MQSQPKLDAIPKKNTRDLSLTKEERGLVFGATKSVNPNVSNKAFEMAYGIALWKADNQKRGINPGSSLDTVDISLSSETDNKDDSGEGTDSSEDGMQVIRDDLLRQEQVSPPSSPGQNLFLTGLMKSPSKLQLEEQQRPALDKESLSPVSPTKQAMSNRADSNQGHKSGDVTGHGGSVSASLGLSSLVSVDNAHQLDRQTAADTIRNGSLLSLPQPTKATGNNSDASPQVEKSRDVPRKRVQRTPEEDILRRKKFALNSKAIQEKEDQNLGLPTDPIALAMRAKRIAFFERELAAVKRFRDHEQARQRPPGEQPLPGQRVLTETFFVNRLEEIRQFAGDAKLGNFKDGFGRYTREEEIARIFGRFQRENNKGDPLTTVFLHL